MKNIHVLRTDKPSRLIIYSTLLNEFRLLDEPIEDWKHKKNICITNSEEIKDEDWCLGIDSDNVKYLVKMNPTDNVRYHTEIFKIILTTDQELIKDGVQAIDDKFLEWFVKNPSCEKVLVTNLYGDFNPIKYDYEIIIPKEKVVNPNNQKVMFHQERQEYFYEDFVDGKLLTIWLSKNYTPKEEPKQNYNGVHFRHCYQGEYEDGCKYGENDCPAKPLKNFKLQCKDCNKNLTDCTCIEDTIDMKQETLEEAADRLAYDSTEENIGFPKIKAFKDGAKWQQEQDKKMYSEEEVLEIVSNCDGSISQAKKWFEQFSKLKNG